MPPIPGPSASTPAFSLEGPFSSLSRPLSCYTSRWILASQGQDPGSLEQGESLHLCSPLPSRLFPWGPDFTAFFSPSTQWDDLSCHRKALFLRTGKPIEIESKISCCHGLGGGENGGGEGKREGMDFFLL